MKIKAKELKKGDQFSLNNGIYDTVKNIKTTKNSLVYFDIKTYSGTFEVNGNLEVNLRFRIS